MSPGVPKRTRFSVVALTVITIASVPPPTAAAQAAEGSFDRTLNVTGPVDLEVKTGSGTIEVRPGTTGRVQVSGRIRAHKYWSFSGLDPAEKVRRLEANPPIEHNGNVIRIGRIEDEDLRNNVSISYVLFVPTETTLRAASRSGRQIIEGLRGPVEAKSGSGSVTVRRIQGEVNASTGSGSIAIDSAQGGLRASTGSGSIDASNVTGALTAKTGSGSVEASLVGQGDVEVSTGSGSIRVDGVHGRLRATSGSGSIDAEGSPAGEWRLSAASGSITVQLPNAAAFDLDARTSSGRIASAHPVTVVGTIGRREIRGAVRGGGPLLYLRTSSGGIDIQ